MHRHDAALRQQVIEDGEDRLLHFAGIGGAADQHQAARQIHGNDGFRPAIMTCRVGAEARQIDDGQARRECRQIGAVGTDQQVADEQIVPGQFAVKANGNPRGGIGAGVEILGVETAAAGMGQHVGQQAIEGRRRHRAVAGPPDGVFGRRIADNEFVLRRAAGVFARRGGKGAAGSQPCLAIADGVFIKGRFGQIPFNRGGIAQIHCRLVVIGVGAHDGRCPVLCCCRRNAGGHSRLPRRRAT